MRLTRLGIQAGKTKEEMASINNEIYRTSQLSDINVDPSQIISAIEKIVSKTGDLDFARENIKNLAYTISATGAMGEDVGSMSADIFEKYNIKGAQNIIETLSTLVEQGKAGSFELKDLATQGARATAAYGSFGRIGRGAVSEMGAMLQMAAKGTGSPEQATTAFEALIRNFTDAQKMSKLEKSGIKIKDLFPDLKSLYHHNQRHPTLQSFSKCLGFWSPSICLT